ncbi:Ndr family protein [Dactylosporangium sucinum]|uniref:Ndr family protein n=1 Tax=Dactylosporangium sucinum TaxID=1424081 RepID=A0A917U395_9ACTN|nr:Ndr family protein [Dactylosporangium sucinum]
MIAEELQREYRRLLDRWPVPSEQLRVPTGQGETFVVACGPAGAPPLVLLHGAIANSASWMGDAAGLSERFRVYAVDVIGEAGLSAPARPPLASDAYAAWLDDVLDGLGVDRAAFAGISLGGWLALDYAIRRPDRVDRLVVLNPGGVGRQRWGAVLLSVVLLPFGRWGRRVAVGRALGAALPGPFMDYFLRLQAAFRPRREVLPVFGDAALRGIRAPLLAVLGGRDALLDAAGTRRRLEALVPHATVRFLPGAGHAVTGQTDDVLAFLTAQPPSARMPNVSP